MRLNLIKVGNSKGIIIPAAVLASCDLKDSVELQIDGKKLVIEAVRQPRVCWFDALGDEPRKELEDVTFDTIPLDEGDEEWVW